MLPNLACDILHNVLGQGHILHVTNTHTSPQLITEDLSGAAAALQDRLNVSILIAPCGISFDRSDWRETSDFCTNKLYNHKVLADV